MIEQDALVIDTSPGRAEVEVLRQSACGACGAQGGCGVSLLDRILGRRPQRLVVDDGLGTRVGETVVIGLAEGALIRAALAAYLLPLVGLFAGALVGEGLFPSADLATLAAALAGFGLALLWLRGYSRRLALDPRFRARLLRRAVRSTPVAVTFPPSR